MARSKGSAQRLFAAPLTWHVISLAVGFVYILALQRNQWFFFDEWAFLQVGGPGYLEPHVGHWSTSLILFFHFLRDTLGLGSYLPFAIAVTLAHLVTAHLVWRIAVRARANPWITTAGVTVLVVLGSGAENILWGFQVGFLTSLALGLLAFLLADSPTLSNWRLVAITAVSLFALTWSGTVIPLIAATAALIAHRHGVRRAVVYAGASALTYGAWYVLVAVGNTHTPDTGGFGLVKIFVHIPQFLGVMLLLGWDSIFYFKAVGIAVLLALLVWLIVLWRRKARIEGFSMALLPVGAAALFAFMAAFSRAELSIGAGRASRYLYVLVALLLPLCLVALTRLVRERRRGLIWTCAALVALAGYQASLLWTASQEEAAKEQGSMRLISAAISLYLEDPAGVDPAARPDFQWAPDMTLADFVVLYERGSIPLSDFTESDLAAARAAVGTR